MTKGYLITGTDTGVGKTFITRALSCALKDKGQKVGVMKPVETGCKMVNGRLLPADATLLKEAASFDIDLDVINPFRFARALSPHLAAREASSWIDIEKITKYYQIITGSADTVLVEGAGGLMAPISYKETIADIALALNIPVIIVAASRLGVLNHTLLTVRMAEKLGLTVAGIIVNHTAAAPTGALDVKTDGDALEKNALPHSPADLSLTTNAEEIRKLLPDTPFLGEVPYSSGPEAIKEAAERIDVEGF